MPYETGTGARSLDEPVYLIREREIGARDPALQDALALIYDTPERPRCLCVKGGVEMYVAKYDGYVVKRLPNDARSHHPRCPHYEPPPEHSGLGELLGDAVIEGEDDVIELKAQFPLVRMHGRAIGGGAGAGDPGEVKAARKRLSLRGLTHFLWHRAQFNRWYPAMAGKRNWHVVQRHLAEAAEHVRVKNHDLAKVLYVPPPFAEATKELHAAKREEAFGPLHSPEARVHFRLMVVLGELKSAERIAGGVRVLVKHMPDCPLLMETKAWDRCERVYKTLLQAKAADNALHVIMTALIFAKRERMYEVAAASLMLTTEQWLPVEGPHEVALLRALVADERRFVKPLRFEANADVQFPTALLMDADPPGVPLFVISVHDDEARRDAAARAARAACERPWLWRTDEAMQALPARARA